jgi:hypothetical protein
VAFLPLHNLLEMLCFVQHITNSVRRHKELDKRRQRAIAVSAWEPRWEL